MEMVALSTIGGAPHDIAETDANIQFSLRLQQKYLYQNIQILIIIE